MTVSGILFAVLIVLLVGSTIVQTIHKENQMSTPTIPTPGQQLDQLEADVAQLKTDVGQLKAGMLTDDQRYAFLTKAERDLLTGQRQDAAAQVVAVEGGSDPSLPTEMAAQPDPR